MRMLIICEHRTPHTAQALGAPKTPSMDRNMIVDVHLHAESMSEAPTSRALQWAHRAAAHTHDQRRACTTAGCLLYTSPSPRDVEESRMPSSA